MNYNNNKNLCRWKFINRTISCRRHCTMQCNNNNSNRRSALKPSTFARPERRKDNHYSHTHTHPSLAAIHASQIFKSPHSSPETLKPRPRLLDGTLFEKPIPPFLPYTHTHTQGQRRLHCNSASETILLNNVQRRILAGALLPPDRWLSLTVADAEG